MAHRHLTAERRAAVGVVDFASVIDAYEHWWVHHDADAWLAMVAQEQVKRSVMRVKPELEPGIVALLGPDHVGMAAAAECCVWCDGFHDDAGLSGYFLVGPEVSMHPECIPHAAEKDPDFWNAANWADEAYLKTLEKILGDWPSN